MRKYELIYSKRKTISLKIKENGTLEIRAPFKTSKSKINEFIYSKERWINKHLPRIKANYEKKRNFSLDFGDYVEVKGEKTLICSIKGSVGKYENKKFLIPETYNSDEIKIIIIELYKEIAKRYIIERVNFFKKKMDVSPTGIRITSAKTRWGSCSSKNSINFSWRLIMGNEKIIDYVIVHELAHIKEHNHSPSFWKIVESIFPDYKKRRKELNDLGKKYLNENWD